MSGHHVAAAVIWSGVLAVASLSVMAWRQRPRPGSTPFAVVMACATWWTATSALGLFAPDETMRLFWTRVEWAGVAVIPVAWLVFALEYTGREEYVTRRSVAALLVLPAATVALAMTNAAHELVYVNPAIATRGDFAVLSASFGPWFWVNFAYAQSLLLVGTVLLFQLVVKSRALYLGQVAVLMLVVGPPWLAHLAYVFSAGPVGSIDPTPFTFVMSGAAGLVALSRFRFLDAVPVTDRTARQSLIDDMEAGVVVVDADDRIVDVNPRARRIFGDAAVGVDAAAVVEDYERIVGADQDRPTMRVTREDGDRVYEVQVTELGEARDGAGRILVCHDVTDRRTRLQRLDVLNRVLRHNLRNEMNVVYGHADRIESGEGDPEDLAGRIKDKSMDLVALADQAREIDAVLQAHGEAAPTEIASIVEWEAKRVREDHPEVTLETVVPDVPVRCSAALETVLKSLVEIAVEHNDTSDPTVRIAVSVEETTVTVAVSDDGPGIPDHERRVLAAGEETKLEHGQGLRLWLANWGAESLGGRLEITDNYPRGSVVRVTVPGWTTRRRPDPDSPRSDRSVEFPTRGS